MVDVMGVLGAVFNLAIIGGVFWYIYARILPLFQETLAGYTGDDRPARLLRNFLLLFIAFEAVSLSVAQVENLVNALLEADLLLPRAGFDIGGALLARMRWGIRIAALIFIGYSIRTAFQQRNGGGQQRR